MTLDWNGISLTSRGEHYLREKNNFETRNFERKKSFSFGRDNGQNFLCTTDYLQKRAGAPEKRILPLDSFRPRELACATDRTPERSARTEARAPSNPCLTRENQSKLLGVIHDKPHILFPSTTNPTSRFHLKSNKLR